MKQKTSERAGVRRPIPFDDALRRVLSAPPQHKTAKKKVATRRNKKS